MPANDNLKIDKDASQNYAFKRLSVLGRVFIRLFGDGEVLVLYFYCGSIKDFRIHATQMLFLNDGRGSKHA